MAAATALARNTIPETTTDSGKRFQAAEKRRSPRYKSSGSAELRDDGLDVWTWVTQQ
jgi:hypothetical protein